MTNSHGPEIRQQYIDRPPRIQPLLPEQVIEIPPPPDKKMQNQGIVRVLLPLLSILGYSLVSVFGGGRNVLFMLPMALSVVASTSFAFYSQFQERKRLREMTQAYTDRLRIMRADLDAAHHEQRLYYEHTHPQIDTIKDIGSGKYKSRMGERLWERRISDPDFASLRLGIGDIPSRVVYTFRPAGSIDEDFQTAEALQLAEDSQTLRNTPVTISLKPPIGKQGEQPNLSGQHSIGISGNTQYVIDSTLAFVMQFATFHAPEDFHIYVLGSPEAAERWQWARWLPHTNTSDGYEGDRMCFEEPLHENEDPKKAQRIYPKRFLEAINKSLEERRIILSEKGQGEDTQGQGPFILLIVDNLANNPNDPSTTSWLDDITAEAAVSAILNNGPILNAGVMFLVPQNAKVPSDCKAVCEIAVKKENYTFRYSEVGQNTPRYVGIADRITPDLAERFAKQLRDKRIRRSYGEDLPNNVSILDLFNSKTIEGLDIVSMWQHSKAHADWLRVPIGRRAGNDIHEIYFHQDYDGVHGMIAGTTGSGKSEMLLTLIAGLAMSYDPSILNFVLVDYKGGSAFEPFRDLPHCVDIVTNLDGKAVDRMFIAIDSELRRRSKILADYNVKHIVEYREKGYHLEAPFPHLFIVVDEFAEMINENKEYKNRFDSITRLGRAIGVHLILATQRPSGVVTDQMRANMKLRICLRVETGDDSRELLGSSDAMFLPSGIPGRAYLQVGKETPNLLQVARAGGPYTPPSLHEDKAIKFDVTMSIKMDKSLEETKSIVDLIVAETIRFAGEHSEPQYKPWPDPLPTILPLNHPVDAKHLVTHRKKLDNKIVIHPILRAWMLFKSADSRTAQDHISNWRNSATIKWQVDDLDDTQSIQYPLQAPIGLIDLPNHAKQHIFTMDLTEGPIVIFGAGGWGKTTFLKTLLLSLAATHSPDNLWVYALDFTRGSLGDLALLPHMETAIDAMESARVERLLRILATTLDERTNKIREFGSLVHYNAHNPDNTLPAVVVAINNFAEFKESYENHLDLLTTLIRDGRALGLYFVITADQVSAVPSKIYNLCTQRLSLKMADPSDYQGIVGRAVSILTETPGRGAISIEREPREFHVGVVTEPENTNTPTISYTADYSQYYRKLTKLMRDEWNKPLSVPEVKPLSSDISLSKLNLTNRPPAAVAAAFGLRDIDRKTAWLELNTHCLIIGPALSGKTTLLHNIVVSLAENYTPQEVGMIFIDARRLLFDYHLTDAKAKNSLTNLPHKLFVVSETEEADLLLNYLDAEFYPDVQKKIRETAKENGLENVFLPENPSKRHIVIIIDNYDDIGDLEHPKLIDKLTTLARKYRDRVHLILSGTPEIARARDALVKRVETARYSIVLNSIETVKNLGAKINNYSLKDSDLPIGRGFIVKSGQTFLVQSSRLDQEENQTYAQALDKFINTQKQKHEPAQWYFQGSEALLESSLSGKDNAKALSNINQEIEEIEIADPVAEKMKEILGNANNNE